MSENGIKNIKSVFPKYQNNILKWLVLPKDIQFTAVEE